MEPGRLFLARLDDHEAVARESGLLVHERAVGAIRLEPLLHPNLGVVRLDGNAVLGVVGVVEYLPDLPGLLPHGIQPFIVRRVRDGGGDATEGAGLRLVHVA